MVNYGFISLEEGKRMGEIIKIANPLTEKQNVMRPSLIPGLLNNLVHNLNQGNSLVKVFELGRVFSPRREQTALGALLSGEGDIYDLKGILEALCEELAIPSPRFGKAISGGSRQPSCFSMACPPTAGVEEQCSGTSGR